MRKIMFVIHSLTGGGAENVLINILSHLDRTKFIPFLVLFYKKGRYLKELPEDVIIYDLKSSTWYQGLLAVFKLSRIIYWKKPALIFSFLWRINLMSILATLVLASQAKLVISEHTLLTTHLNYTKINPVRWLIQKLVQYLYTKVDLIIAVAQKIKEDLVYNFKIPPEKVKVIYNPVNIEQLKLLALEEPFHPWFRNVTCPILISVGRLEKWKGFAYLLKAFRILRNKLLARLVILGEGPEKRNLIKLTKKLSLENDVAFLGFQSNPYKYIKRSSLFVLPSLYEGCPMTVLEALALGVPIIATDSPSGLREIIQNGKNGFLVPAADEYSLAETLFNLLQDEKIKKLFSLENEKKAQEFALSRILKEYEVTIESVLYKNVTS